MWKQILNKLKSLRKAQSSYVISGEALPEDQRKGSYKKKFVLGLLVGISVTLIINYFLTSFFTFFSEINQLKTPGTTFNFLAVSQINFRHVFSFWNVFRLYSFKLIVPYFALILLIALAVMSKANFGSKEQIAYGQKGDSRFTTLEELEAQYKKIPDHAKEYPGSRSFKGIGGIPISHYKNSYFIDTDTVNSLTIGVSRSGKGELLITPFIDIISRAEILSSMVVNDPKGELYAASKDVLEARGYDVQVLNIQDPTQSMSYNPLQLVKEAWLEGNREEASKRANSIAFSLYNDPNAGENAFFNETAQSAVTAIILTLVEFCVDHNCPEKITMGNVVHLLNELGTINWIDPVSKTEKNALDEWFKALPQGHVAKKRYGATSFAGSKTRGSILATANNGLQPFVDPLFVRMTSRSSIDLKQVGFPKYLMGQLAEKFTNKRIKIQLIKKGKPPTLIKEYSQKIKARGFFFLNFDEFDRGVVKENEGLQDGDFIRIEAPSESNQDSEELLYQCRFIPKKDKQGKEIYLNINGVRQVQYERKVKLVPLQVDSPMSIQNPLELYYSNKPTAVFMIIPDYDSSNHALSSIFVKQLYTTLAQNAVETKGNKTFKRVQFILDEFGNMPAIDDMDNVMTVSLGRNILFNLFVQSFSQLTNKYGENITNTIKENCQNWIYIMAINKETIQEFVEQAGSKTVASFSTNGQTHLSLDKNLSQSAENNALITFSRLKQLIEGETLIIRSLHRQDQKGKKIRPFPIFNTKETRMPYRWEFLSEWIDTSKSLNEIDIPSDHADLDLAEITIDANQFIVNKDILSSRQEKVPKNTINHLKKLKSLVDWFDSYISNEYITTQEDLGLSDKYQGIVKTFKEVSSSEFSNSDFEKLKAIDFGDLVKDKEIARNIIQMLKLIEFFQTERSKNFEYKE